MIRISKLKNYKFKTVWLYGRCYYYFSRTEKTKTKYRLRYLNRDNEVIYQKETDLFNCIESGYLSLKNEQILSSDIKRSSYEYNDEKIRFDIFVLKELLYWMYGI